MPAPPLGERRLRHRGDVYKRQALFPILVHADMFGTDAQNAEETALSGLFTIEMPPIMGAVSYTHLKNGCMMASGDKFDIYIKGEGSHGSQPALGHDPSTCAAQVISARQNITSREIPGDEPRVLSICQVHSGSAWNIIPDQAYMQGTIRTTDPKTRAFYVTRITEVVEGICAAMRCEGRVDWVEMCIRDSPPAGRPAAAARRPPAPSRRRSAGR